MSTIEAVVIVWPGAILVLGYIAVAKIMKHNDSTAAKIERSLKAQGLANLKGSKPCN